MASLLEVWNAGTHVASQALDMVSAEKKYVQDVDLFNASMDMEEKRTQLAQAREMIYDDSGVNWQNNPDYPKDFNQYLDKQLGEWRQKWGEKYTGSRYFTDNLHEIERRGGAALNQALAQAEVNYATQQVRATFKNEINVIRNNPNLDTERKRSLELELLERTRGAPGIDQAFYEENRDLILAQSLEEELHYTPEAGISAGAIRERYDALAGDTLKEGGLYAALPNAKKAVDIGRDAAVAAQWAYNFQGLQEVDTAYEVAKRDYQTAVASGDPARVNTAFREMMEAYSAGKPLQEAALGKSEGEYNPDNRLRIMAMFEDPPALAAAGGGAGGKGASVSSQDEYIELLTRWAKGQYSGPEAHALLTDYLVEQLIKTGKSDLYLSDLFFNDLAKGIEKVNPQWNTDVLNPVKAVVQSLKKESGLDEAAIALINTKVANSLIDMVGDMGLGTYTTEQWIARGRDMARIAAGMVIDNLKVTNEGASTVKGLEGIGSPGNLLKLYKNLEAHPELIYQNAAGETGSLINQSTLDDIQNQVMTDIGVILGEDAANLTPEWENDGAYDIKPIPQIRVNHGKNQGIYKYQVNEEGTGLDVRKYNETSGQWEAYRAGAADQILREDKKTEKLTSKQHEYSDFINNLVKHKDDKYFRMPSWNMKPPDTAFYIEGYDSRTLDRVTEIPKDVADSIQRSSTPQVWEEIQRAWTGKGIRISTQNSAPWRRNP